jgi:hypothetical protein
MTTSPAHSARPDRESPPDTAAKPKIDLSPAQVLGGALAAMTAAFLGSRLSVAGTVVGAALASVVAAVGGSLYTASLRTTQEKVKTVFQGRVAGSSVPTTVETVSWDEPTAAAPSARAAQSDRGGRVSWKRIAVAALAAFALAGVVLTGLELATGQALSGGKGTTISQVTEQDPAPKTKPTTAPTSASPSPSEASPTTSTTPVPTPEASTSAPEPSATATEATPVPAPSASTSSTPSASATPVSPTPSAGG